MTPWQKLSKKPAMIFAGLCTLVSCGTATLLASDRDCGVPPGMTNYVENSPELVAQGVPLEEVLEVLACLARPISDTQDLPPNQVAPARRRDRRDVEVAVNRDDLARIIRVLQSPRAVQAIFQLCDSDACIRRYLLEIAADRETTSHTQGLACHLLVYVADAEVADRLFVLAKEAWGKSYKFSGYANALQDIGSTDFLRWLDSTVEKGLEDGTILPHQVTDLRRRAKHIRIQEDPELMLDYLSSFDGSVEPSWAVHQACRHGIDRSGIRSAVLAGLASGKDDRRKQVHFEPLLSDCEAMGLLSSEEVREARVFPLNSLPSPEKRRTHWADSKLEAKRHAFWRIDRLSDNSDQ